MTTLNTPRTATASGRLARAIVSWQGLTYPTVSWGGGGGGPPPGHDTRGHDATGRLTTNHNTTGHNTTGHNTTGHNPPRPSARKRFPFVTMLLASAFLLLASAAAFAVEPSERLADPVLEARARTISEGLRCLVCQNESIDESNADLAHDIRIFVRQLLTQGDTNAQVIQAVVTRYGQFVLLKPPVEPATYVLWYGPPLLVVIGLAGSLLWLRRRQTIPADAAPLSPEETRRLDGLMRERDG
jgi:cytochrome c-type biogenesis protein CcmH